MRRYEFPGKRRLRLHLRVPETGEQVVRFPEGMTLKLDLSESLQRDFYAGLHDAHELRLVGRLLATGGDFVDVGAHIGLYSVYAALQGRGRVLAFEPNPTARAQLQENLRLNHCHDVVLVGAAASSQPGRAQLAVPRTNDPSFSTLERADFQAETLDVPVTTVDAEVARFGLDPVLVKLDVQDHELEVLNGMTRTLERRPAVLCEVGPETAAQAEALLSGLGYELRLVEPRRLRRASAAAAGGYRNLLALPIR
jgi:FkbM family methyltransferase